MTAQIQSLRALAALFAFTLMAACTASGSTPGPTAASPPALTAEARAGLATAVFAGGCFWCMEKPFDELPGVVATISGYTGGTLERPTYRQVTAGGTGHFEAVEVVYDPTRISYDRLLEVYWRQVDPFDGGGQFCDRGDSYRPAIFVGSETERTAAEAAKAGLATRFSQPIAVEILPKATFWAAEDYHQDYYLKNPARYSFYRSGCGRDARLRAVWGER